MEGPRSPYKEEQQEIIDFLDHNLRDHVDWSLKDEYPTVFENNNSYNVKIIKKDDKILSHAVTKVHIVKTPVGIFKVAAIGSVCTDKNHRNQGLSRKVLEASIEAARNHGCDFAILWSDLYDFYKKLGFEAAGREHSWLLDKKFEIEPHQLKIIKGKNISGEALLRLYTHHTVGVVRTPRDYQRFLEIPNSNIYTAWDQNNQLKAYAVEGKGADLAGYIHEWGGNLSHLFPLLNYALEDQQKPLRLITPEHSLNLNKKLTEKGYSHHQGFLGLIKILIPQNLMSKVKRHARALGIDDFIFEYQEGFFYIGTVDNLFKTDSEIDLTRLIFGPSKASQIYNFDSKTKETLETCLPIPMWMWGWDSI
ncbi:MAG: GNAT family N-acetyltransferase [Bdellovibrionales bacterium]|nr:GNAT family N-acetyltransferase [Bdellovibrionales bacterium]